MADESPAAGTTEPSTNAPSSTGSAAGPAGNPIVVAAPTPQRAVPSRDEAALEQKKHDLDQAKTDADSASAKATSLAVEVKVLEARVAEVKQVNNAYSSAAPKLNVDLAQSKSDLDTKLSMAKAAVKSQQDAIDKTVKDFDADLASQIAKLQQLHDAADKLRAVAAQADAKVASAQTALASMKSTAKNADDQIKAVKALQDQASKAEAQGDFTAMYFLLNEASTMLKSISLDTPQDYATKIAAAQDDLQAAQVDAGAKKADASQRTAVEADAAARVNAATAGRRTSILTQLKKLPRAASAA